MRDPFEEKNPQAQPVAPVEGPRLEDAISDPKAGTAPNKPEAPKVAAKPITREKILQLGAALSSIGLEPGLRRVFIDDYVNDALIELGLDMSGLESGLAELGITATANNASPLTRVLIGAGALVAGGAILRASYRQHGPNGPKPSAILEGLSPDELAQLHAMQQQARSSTPEGDPGFTVADLGEPVPMGGYDLN